MQKICPQCHKVYEAGKFCVDCGVTLVEQQPSPAGESGGFNLKFGDANAISGGVNLSDNHSVSHNTVNTTTSSVDSHNVITNNITHVEREKSKEERMLEGKQAFREACKQAFSNGVCTSEEKRRLDDLRFSLGLDDETAAQIFENARTSVHRKSVVLGPIQKMTLDKIQSAVRNNQLDQIHRLFPQLIAMVKKFSVEEIQYTYYMLQAILTPGQCIEDYKSHREDKYWQTFWASVAYRLSGDIEKADSLLFDVQNKWADKMPEENTFILAAVGAILDRDVEMAKTLFDHAASCQSACLEPLVGCLYGLLYTEIDTSEEVRDMVNSGIFYRDHLFASVSNPKAQKRHIETDLVKKSEIVLEPDVAEKQNVTYDESYVEQHTDSFGYLRSLSSDEIIRLKEILLAAPSDNYMAKFHLGQLYIQESESAVNMKMAYEAVKDASSHGIGQAAAFLAYFYLYGKVVKADLKEAESRIKIDSDYKKNPIYIQMLIDLYTKAGNTMLSDVWRTKLNKLK